MTSFQIIKAATNKYFSLMSCLFCPTSSLKPKDISFIMI